MTATVPARSRGRRAEPVAPAPRARLRAVPTVRASRRAGALAVMVIGLVFAILLGAVLLNSRLITGQQQLDKLDQSIDDARARQDRLRLDVAQLESPQRIVAAAQSQGMVPAPRTIWVLPAVPTDDPSLQAAPTTPPPAPSGSERATGPATSTADPSQP